MLRISVRSLSIGSLFIRTFSIRTLLLVGTALSGWLFATHETSAGGLALREQSAVGQGASFAGAGTPGMGLSAMFWNPAAVTQATGLWSEGHAAFVLPRSTVTAGPGTSPVLLGLGASQEIGAVGFIPASYTAYRINPNLYVGLAINAPFGLATEARLPWAGQQLALRAEAKSIDINPIVGWRVNDVLSVAAGPRVVWFKGEFSRALLPGGTAAAALPVGIEVEDIGLGFTAGLTLTPWQGTEIALGYRSQVNLELEGDLQFPASAILGALGLAAFSGLNVPISGGVTLPDQVTLGLRHRVTDALTVLGTVEWTNWSTVQNVPFTFTGGPAPGVTATTLTFNYDDGWFFSGGVEYRLLPTTTLRAGIGYEISPIPDAVRDPSLPDNNRWWFSAGLTHALTEKLTFDVGYSFLLVEDAPVNVVPGHPDFANLIGVPGARFIASADSEIHIIAASLRYKWSSAAAEPVVRKY